MKRALQVVMVVGAFGVWAAQSRAATAPAALVKSDFLGTLDLRLGTHVDLPPATASERILLNARQRYEFSNGAAVSFGARFFGELTGGRSDVAPATSQEEDQFQFRLSDTYFQRDIMGWAWRVGYQQVVWGETFGFSRSDLVNSKDLRFGMPLNSDEIRLPSPIIKTKLVGSRASLEFVYIPQPNVNLMPYLSSIYTPLSSFPALESKQVTIVRQTTLPWGYQGGEYGTRVAATFGGVDVALFALHYFDRYPFYDASLIGGNPDQIQLSERHSRVTSAGLASAFEASGFVLRTDFVYTWNKTSATLEANLIGRVSSNELSVQFEVDFPSWKKLTPSLLFSTNHLAQDAFYLIYPQTSRYLSLRALLNLTETISWDSVLSMDLMGSSYKLQSEFKQPLASWLEVKAGAEIFLGSSNSEFGRYEPANNLYVALKGYFSGFRSGVGSVSH